MSCTGEINYPGGEAAVFRSSTLGKRGNDRSDRELLHHASFSAEQAAQLIYPARQGCVQEVRGKDESEGPTPHSTLDSLCSG